MIIFIDYINIIKMNTSNITDFENSITKKAKPGKSVIAIGLAVAAIVTVCVISAVVLGLIPVYLSIFKN
jgi:hypothetical protein